jgi:hypothetical protein
MRLPWGKIVPYLVKYAPLLVEALLAHHLKEEAAKQGQPATPPSPVTPA